MESICWTCARAYARPDPEGCGLHRVKNKLAYIQKAPFIEGVKVETRKGAKSGPMQVIVVTKCSHYDREDRKTKAKELSFSTLMKHKYGEGIA